MSKCGFNPSDGLGVVRTGGRGVVAADYLRFQSLGRVGGGSDAQECVWRPALSAVSIPRTGWGWFGQRMINVHPQNKSQFQSLGRVGGGSDEKMFGKAYEKWKFQSLGRVGGGSDRSGS